eukprot:3935760-Rhodomonas_salina.3
MVLESLFVAIHVPVDHPDVIQARCDICMLCAQAVLVRHPDVAHSRGQVRVAHARAEAELAALKVDSPESVVALRNLCVLLAHPACPHSERAFKVLGCLAQIAMFAAALSHVLEQLLNLLGAADLSSRLPGIPPLGQIKQAVHFVCSASEAPDTLFRRSRQ